MDNSGVVFFIYYNYAISILKLEAQERAVGFVSYFYGSQSGTFKKEEVRGGNRKPHNEEHRQPYYLPKCY